MRAMILAAGFGSRLGNLTLDQPKPLIRISRHSLIEYSLFLIKKAGIHEVIVNTHYHADKIRTSLQDGRKYGLHITYSHEESILGTGGGLKNAEGFFNGDSFILINSDIICDIDLRDVIDYHKLHKSAATMVVREDNTLPNFNEIKMTDAYRIFSIDSKSADIAQVPYLCRMFTGIHVMEPLVFSYLKPQFSSIISDFYCPALKDNLKIMGYDFSGFWMDAGSADRLHAARNNKQLPVIRF